MVPQARASAQIRTQAATAAILRPLPPLGAVAGPQAKTATVTLGLTALVVLVGLVDRAMLGQVGPVALVVEGQEVLAALAKKAVAEAVAVETLLPVQQVPVVLLAVAEAGATAMVGAQAVLPVRAKSASSTLLSLGKAQQTGRTLKLLSDITGRRCVLRTWTNWSIEGGSRGH